MADKLTVKQEKFVQGLFAGLSQREAYKQAGYSCKRMVDSTIDVRACELAKNSKVKVRLEGLQNEFKERNMVSVERVLQEYARLGFFDPRKLFNADGSPKKITELDDDTTAALAGLEVHETYEWVDGEKVPDGVIKKYKVGNKLGALDSMARHLGMFNDKLNINADITFTIVPAPPPEEVEDE